MAASTELIQERESITPTTGVPVISQSLNNASASTGTVDMSKFNRVEFLGTVGALTSGAAITMYLQQTNNANGAGATNISGAAITSALVNAANLMFSIEVNAWELSARYVLGVINEGAGKACTLSCIPRATDPRYAPQSNDNTAIAVQRVSA